MNLHVKSRFCKVNDLPNMLYTLYLCISEKQQGSFKHPVLFKPFTF